MGEQGTRPVYVLSCAVVLIVLAACVATVVTAIYFSDDSPWRDSECDSSLASNGNHVSQSEANKEGDVVTRTTKLGKIEGKLVKTSFNVMVESYLGIPFALPPVGGNRFKDPQPITKPYPGGVLKAFEFGDSCVQLSDTSQVFSDEKWELRTEISEDCLYLNVWVPAMRRQGRAVMVWIPGGGFTEGSASLPLYSGDVLSGWGDVIVVSLNYRLSVLGFIPLDIPGQSRGNQGIKDQQMALRWVQENIEQFGGDPKQVTIFGESAGAGSVGIHLLTPESAALYNRAVLQSGVPISSGVTTTLSTADYYISQLQNMLCSGEPTLVDCLRGVPARNLTAVAMGLPRRVPGDMLWIPVEDGEFIPGNPAQMSQSGLFHQKDVLIGVNKDEGSFITNMRGDANATWWFYVTAFPLSVRAKQPFLIPQSYPVSDDTDYDELFISVADIISDVFFICPANRFGEEMASFGSKVFHYYLTYRSPSSTFPERYGVAHTTDLEWVFGNPLWTEEQRQDRQSFTYTDGDVQMAKSMMTMWTNFAKYGSSEIAGEAEWGSSAVRSPSYLELRGPYDYIYHRNRTIQGDKCQLWM